VTGPLGRPADTARLALRFVGATSAARDQLATVVGTRHLVDRALALAFGRVIVDTSGLVRGDLGQRLKQAKIDVLAPDVVIALQRDGECEPILAPYGAARRPAVIRIPALAPPRRRSQDDRRRHREQALAAHFSGARVVGLDLSTIVVRTPALFAGPALPAVELADASELIGQDIVWGERRGGEVAIVTRQPLTESEARAASRRLGAVGFSHHALEHLVGMLAGLDDDGLDTLGLGGVVGLDLPARRLTVETAVNPERVRVVAIGRERYRPGP
jgi:polynucleotide 5'-hydroxyl-kinase GRC3/NOL9